MKTPIPAEVLIAAVACAAAVMLPVVGMAAPGRPTLLYARHFNADGEERYLPGGDYRMVLEQVGATFEVRAHADAPDAEMLAETDVLLISNPSHAAVAGHPEPPRFQPDMIARLVAFVENGGGLIIMGNQENHNLEMETTNRLLAHFGMRFEETYTDIKALDLPEEIPLLGGLRWGYYSGNQLVLEASHPARPEALARNDLSQPLLKGLRDAPGTLLAWATPGKGRVIAVTDAGWITNTVLDGPGIADVRIDGHHNLEIFRRLVEWAAAPELKPRMRGQEVFAGAPRRVPGAPAGEGPAWDDELGLLASHDGDIVRLHDGVSSVFRKDARTNGLMFDRDGSLLCCEPGRRRVTRMDRAGNVAVLTDSFEGKPYNTPNDLTVDSRGRIYFTDPRYGPRDDMALADAEGRPVEGVYRIGADGVVTRLVTHEVDRPNGILVSGDGRWLFVADNNNDTIGGAHRLIRFAFDQESGGIDPASRRVLFDWGSARGPDGMAQAASGVLYVAAGRTRPRPPFESAAALPGGIYAFSTDGELLGFQPVAPDEVTNCAIGGRDRRTLFVTAGGELWSIALP